MREKMTIEGLIYMCMKLEDRGGSPAHSDYLAEVDEATYPDRYDIPIFIRYLIRTHEELEQEVHEIISDMQKLPQDDSGRFRLCDDIRWIKNQANCLQDIIDRKLSEVMLAHNQETYCHYALFEGWEFAGIPDDQYLDNDDEHIIDGEHIEFPQSNQKIVH